MNFKSPKDYDGIDWGIAIFVIVCVLAICFGNNCYTDQYHLINQEHQYAN